MVLNNLVPYLVPTFYDTLSDTIKEPVCIFMTKRNVWRSTLKKRFEDLFPIDADNIRVRIHVGGVVVAVEEI
jgi:hypothetical protein